MNKKSNKIKNEEILNLILSFAWFRYFYLEKYPNPVVPKKFNIYDYWIVKLVTKEDESLKYYIDGIFVIRNGYLIMLFVRRCRKEFINYYHCFIFNCEWRLSSLRIVNFCLRDSIISRFYSYLKLKSNFWNFLCIVFVISFLCFSISAFYDNKGYLRLYSIDYILIIEYDL